MTTPERINKLRQMSDELAEMAEQVRDEDDSRSVSPSAQLRRASYLLEDAVSDLLQTAATQYKLKIVPGSVEVLRERRAA